MLKRFRLEEPQSVAEVSELLGRFGDGAKVYAGGTELLLAMKEGLVDYERLVNIKNVAGLDGIEDAGATINIGALCTHHQLESSAALKEKLPSLARLEQNVANVRVRQAGTLGGNLCFAEPHADPGTLLIALGATMTAAKGSSNREIAAADFFVDAYETSLAADEVLTEIRIPAPGPDARSVYLKFGYLERPSVGVALALDVAGGAVRNVRVAVGCAGPAPKRVEEAEAVLEGKEVDEALRHLAQAGTLAGRASQAISDLHGSQEYKEHIVGVLLKRAFQSAVS
jgi:aerobic carbon-monoxide dehydrogenase medium subunit